MRLATTDASPGGSQQAGSPVKKWRVRIWFGAAVIGFSVLSLIYLRLTGDVATAGYDVANLQSEVTRWEKRNEQARLETARLESLDRIAQIASDRLKMGPAQREVYVKATAVAVPAVPTPEPTAGPVADPLVVPSLRQVLGVP